MFVLVTLSIIAIKIVMADLKIDSVVMKPMRIDDIGLNFDMSVSNMNGSAAYTFKVSCEKCCVVVCEDETECSSKIVGGSFGEIFPGKSQVVTLVWPTIVIFNRIGYCDVAVIATRSDKTDVRLTWRIEFNTTYDANSKDNKIFDYIPKTANISNCDALDLNPLDHCSPINCEAKYMGKRNYYDPLKQKCQPVPECNHAKDEIYDYIQNECITLSKILTQSDLKQLRSGEFDDYDWVPSAVNSPFLDNFDYTEAERKFVADESLRKNRAMESSYTLYFTVANCAIALFISITFYCILGIVISTSSLGRRRKKKAQEPEEES